jgi:hypothetical protein
MKLKKQLAGNRLAMAVLGAIFATSSANAFDVPVHVKVTNTVMATQKAMIGGTERKFSAAAMKEVADANEAVDSVLTRSAALWHPERHFTNEEFVAASQRLIDLRKQVIDKAKAHDGSAARVALGQAFHTMQDFYAHSNYNDINVVVESRLGRATMPDPSPAGAQCPDDPNVLGAGGGGSMTSYYFIGLITSEPGCDEDELPANKCWHGNYSTGCPGLNKDLDATGAAEHGVPMNPKHPEAALSAQHSTRLFIEGILSDLSGDDQALASLLDVRGGLAFVLDNTGSMGSSLNGVKGAVSAMVAEASADPARAPDKYVLEVFGDPDVGTPYVTDDVAAFQGAIGSVGADGGGDCPELAQNGLIRAVDAAPPNSRILMFSDATSKDGAAINQVIASAQAKGSVINYGLTGSCSPTDPAYIRGAAETGGQVFRLYPSEIPSLYDFIRPQIKGKMATIARRRIDLGAAGTNSMPVPVDTGLSDLLVAVSIAENNVPAHQNVRLVRPSGAVVASTDPGVKIVSLAFGLFAYVEHPEPGLWTVDVEGYGPYTATAQGNSPVDLARFDFVEPNGDIHGGFFPITGQPIAGVSNLGQASVLGPIATAQFNLIDEAGADLGPISLADHFPSANPENYLGEIPLPSVPFRVQASGVDEHGLAYQRQYPAVYRAQQVQVLATGFSLVDLIPGEDKDIAFTVKNLGPAGSFRTQAVDARGYVQQVTPALVDLGTGETANVTVTLRAPADAQDGEESSVAFSANRTDSPTTFNSAITLATVVANAPPVCVAQLALQAWPPNGSFVAIDLASAAGATDPDGDALGYSITSITQDEPVSGPGFGTTMPDAAGKGGSVAQIRAERAGNGNGRVYAINYEATDPKGAHCSGVLNVTVPHGQNGAPATDDGQQHTSTAE